MPAALSRAASGLLVIAYTVAGGSDAVTHTQKYQLTVAMGGMVAAFVILILKLPAGGTAPICRGRRCLSGCTGQRRRTRGMVRRIVGQCAVSRGVDLCGDDIAA